MTKTAKTIAQKLAEALERLEALEAEFTTTKAALRTEQAVVKKAVQVIDTLNDRLAKESARTTRAAEVHYTARSVADELEKARTDGLAQAMLHAFHHSPQTNVSVMVSADKVDALLQKNTAVLERIRRIIERGRVIEKGGGAVES
jgi:chromosome segregation ATPase